MAEYDADTSQYTQSLGCWHGFIGQQKLIAIKKHFGDTNKRYLYLSGWMIAALRSEFGPLPDQSMHEKTSVPGLIEELYTFLRQADARELGGLFRELDAARDAGRRSGGEGHREQASTISRPTSCRSSPTSTPASATPRRPTCWRRR
jgi:isocitrate lyase